MADITAQRPVPTTRTSARIPALDMARTAALLAMALYHFVFDLELFGFVAPGTAQTGGWRLLALSTAGSFLFLAGVSLWLAHGRGIRWSSYGRRLARIVAAAALITGATFFAIPGAFIFFGILHAIAAASLIGLVVLRLPAVALVALAALAFWAPHSLRAEAFDAPWLWWTGLQTLTLRSVDYVPVLPWVGPFLLGLAAAKWAEAAGVWTRIAAPDPMGWQRWLVWPGRHSLLVYLIHQPILIPLVWLAAQVLR